MADVNDVNSVPPIRPLPVGPGLGDNKRHTPLPTRKAPDDEHGEKQDDTDGGGIDEYV